MPLAPSGRTTRAVIVSAPRDVVLAELPLQGGGDRDGVEVRVEACGLCTWEQRVYKGAKKTYPFWGGHELCGVLVGDSRELPDGLRAGDRVAVALQRRCGQCRYCTRGLDNHCAYVHPPAVGPGPSGPRGLSETIMVSAHQVAVLGPTVSPEQGTLVEPVACALRSVRRGAPKHGDRVLVLGAGTMGLLHRALLEPIVERVLVADQESVVAQLAGGSLSLATIEALKAEANRPSDDARFDVIFCTRGGPEWIELAVQLADRGGRVVLYQSVVGDDIVRSSANRIHYREIAILGTISQTLDDFAAAAALVRSRSTALLDTLRVAQRPAEACREAFEEAVSGRFNRVIVRMTSEGGAGTRVPTPSTAAAETP